MNCGAVQCGFCVPGFIVSAYQLLQENLDPTREQVRDWFQKHKNVCRCTGYVQITDAVMAAARVMRGECSIEDISFKNPADGEYYGKPVVRPTALAKVCGLADYGEDQELKMPAETLHAAVVQPRIAHHANILEIDASRGREDAGRVQGHPGPGPDRRWRHQHLLRGPLPRAHDGAWFRAARSSATRRSTAGATWWPWSSPTPATTPGKPRPRSR